MTTALVTGSTAGIGYEFARQLAERGHDIVLVARDRARLENVSDELRRDYKIRSEVLVADLSDRAQIEKVAQRLADDARPVDLLVNNAGYGMKKGFLANEIEAEEAMLDVLCTSVLVLSHAAARAMKTRGRGGIINVSSVASYATMGTYSAAKAWVRYFSEGLSRELTGSGVTCMALCPGFTHTEFHERGRMNDVAAPRVHVARRRGGGTAGPGRRREGQDRVGAGGPVQDAGRRDERRAAGPRTRRVRRDRATSADPGQLIRTGPHSSDMSE